MKKIAVLSVIASILLLTSSIALINRNTLPEIDAFNQGDRCFIRSTVVLDAGHGGEDGGAVAADGTLEKNLNLEFTKCISVFFDLFGISYKTTRTTDVSVGDPSLSSVRERKRSDILRRFQMVNQYSDSVLLSIHQNLFTQSEYCGAQVFYAKCQPESEKIAKCIQSTVASFMQPDNHREIKGSDSNIYLLYNAKRPSVLVECGFLSNPEELLKLKSPEYRSALSYAIVRGFMAYCFTQKSA